MNLSARTYFISGFIVLLGIFGQWRGGEFYHLWRFPAAALLLALTLEGLRTRRRPCLLQREVPPRALLGQITLYRLRLHNATARPLVAESMPCYPPIWQGEQTLIRWRLAPGERAVCEVSVVPGELGVSAWGPLYLRVLGDFGLAWWQRVVADAQHSEIVPEHAHSRARLGVQRLGVQPNRRTARHGVELLALRDYQPGDPLRSVDWKATARRGQPVVRLYTEDQHVELMLLLDVGRGSRLQAGALTRLHHYLNVAARLGEIALQHGDQVGLVSFADAPQAVLPLDKGRHALTRLRLALGRLSSQPREANPLAAVLKARTLLKQRGLVVVFTDIEEGEAAQQLLQAVQLLLPKHVPLIAGLIDEEIEVLCHQTAQHWLDPYRSYAALEITAARQRTLKHLQRLGGYTVLARPAQLDSAVVQYYTLLRQRRRI